MTVLAAAVLALAIGLWTVLYDWRRRVSLWQREPERLADAPREHGGAYVVILLLTVAAGVAGAARWNSAWTPLAVIFAAYATLLVAHRTGWRFADVVGLALAGLSWVTIAGGWLPRAPANLWLGLAVAGAHQIWLARFWVQQLDGGRAWTTTGRMIPIARGISAALLPMQLGAIVYGLVAVSESPFWIVLLAALMTGAHVMLFVGDLRGVQPAARGRGA